MIIWLDLETTGSELHQPIVEIGAVITDDELEVVGIPFERVIPVSEDRLLGMDRVVQQMHKDSGLWDAIDETRDKLGLGEIISDGEYDLMLHEASNDFILWMESHGAEKNQQYPIGGRGVAFDRGHITEWMPVLATRLTYWTYDMSPILRFLELSGRKQERAKPSEPHRALPDALAALEDARNLRDLFWTLES